MGKKKPDCVCGHSEYAHLKGGSPQGRFCNYGPFYVEPCRCDEYRPKKSKPKREGK